MNRTHLAICFLTASAFVLSGLLIVRLDTNTARGELVSNHDSLTFLTARTKKDEEPLFVLDNINARLLILRTNYNRKRIVRAISLDLRKEFSDRPQRGDRNEGGYR
jgi:hypothetical protein